MRNIHLVGFMGAGKTSTGRALAKRLGRGFADTDLLAQRRAGMTAAELIGRRGLEAWRRAEASALREALRLKGCVIALGGGLTPTKARALLLRRSGVTVYLECGEDALFRRLAKDLAKRPLLGGDPAAARRAIARLLGRRRPYYERADLTLDTEGLTPGQAAAKIVRMLERHGNRPRR